MKQFFVWLEVLRQCLKQFDSGVSGQLQFYLQASGSQLAADHLLGPVNGVLQWHQCTIWVMVEIRMDSMMAV